MRKTKEPIHSELIDSSRDNQRWLRLWRDQAQSGFHQINVNQLLMRFWPQLNLKKSQRVLVPLCGKSLDLLWLAAQGHEVIGIELSPVAVEDFFRENGLKAKKQRIGKFIRWRANTISIWCGDFFSLSSRQLGRLDAVFDHTALTALSPDIRGAYMTQLISLTTEDATVLLLTVEDVQINSPQAIRPIDLELGELCKGHYSVRLLHSEITPQRHHQTEVTTKSHTKAYELKKSKPGHAP